MALEAGVDADQFWRLTPWQTRVAVRAGHHRMLTLAWHVAALERQKKLPPLDSLLPRPAASAPVPMTAAAMRQVLEAAAKTR